MNELLTHSFHQLSGQMPFDFQTETALRLLDGRNVVLQAPTGAGKTWGALLPFVFARQQGIAFADRLIYALPQRTLAVALYHDTKKALDRVSGIKVTIQTGAMPEDSLFQGDIIFTTIDQLLSAYIGVPVSLPKTRANLPAGAILGAYVVFDEFHLLEPGRALATTLDLADRLQRFTRLLLMSATVPAQILQEIAQRTHAEIVRVTPEQVQMIPSQKSKERRFARCEHPLTAADVLNNHTDRSIVVVNRVERAQQIYEEISTLTQQRELADRLLLLHARFLPEDRQKIEQHIIDHFKKDGPGHAILVATQVIEVGLDISCDTMHTELAPANSIFQRAGRCARYAKQKGTVYVYDLPLNEHGKPAYGPYLNEESLLVEHTGQELAAYNDASIGLAEEKAIVDVVHTDADLNLLHTVSRLQRRSDVEDAMRTGRAEYIRQLIRQVDSVNVIVHDNPDSLRLDLRPQVFSVHRGVMEGLVRSLDLNSEDKDGIRLAVLDEQEQGESVGVSWRPVTSAKDVVKALYLCVSPSLARYDAERGLRLGRHNTPNIFRSQETRTRPDAGFERYSYTKETYEAHVKLVVQQHDAQEPHCRVAASRLAQVFGMSKDEVDALSRLVAALHDVGKLADKWQDAIWRWQTEIHREQRKGYLAHSRFDGANLYQRGRQREQRFKKPPHGVEGAYAVLPIVADHVQSTSIPDDYVVPVTYALITAIARHHSAFSKQVSDFNLSNEACQEAMRVSKIKPSSTPSPRPGSLSDCTKFTENLVLPQRDADAFLLYWYVARRLRLADQQATSMAGGGS